MFRFEHNEFLSLLAMLPILIVLFGWSSRYAKQMLARLGNNAVIAQLIPTQSKFRHGLKFALLLFGIFFLIIGLSNPQWGTKRQKVKSKGVDVFIALDVSESMLAQDIRPNRMLRSREFARDLLAEASGDRVGVVLFACNAYTQVPLTIDYGFADVFLSAANTQLAASQGTSIASAIERTLASFPKEDEEDSSANHKALVIITDGEDHDQLAVEAANAAHEKGLLVFTVGVGKEEGALLPIIVKGRQDYKRDETGNPVRSKLNEALLQQVAEAGGGDYFNLAAGSDEVVKALRERIDVMEKQEREQVTFSDYESHFQFFVAIGLILLLWEFLIAYRRK